MTKKTVRSATTSRLVPDRKRGSLRQRRIPTKIQHQAPIRVIRAATMRMIPTPAVVRPLSRDRMAIREKAMATASAGLVCHPLPNSTTGATVSQVDLKTRTSVNGTTFPDRSMETKRESRMMRRTGIDLLRTKIDPDHGISLFLTAFLYPLPDYSYMLLFKIQLPYEQVLYIFHRHGKMRRAEYIRCDLVGVENKMKALLVDQEIVIAFEDPVGKPEGLI